MSRGHFGFSAAVQDYLRQTSLREAPILARLRAETEQRLGHELAEMQINPEQGQFMAFLVRLVGARKMLEIGTFTGYSALVCALAMPKGGSLITCDKNSEWTQLARSYWREARVDSQITLHLGKALLTLEWLLKSPAAGADSFDWAFIDGDKKNYDNYYERCLQLVRPGGLILLDNTLWGGALADPDNQHEIVQMLRKFNQKLHQDQRVDLSLVTIGDGLTLAQRRF